MKIITLGILLLNVFSGYAQELDNLSNTTTPTYTGPKACNDSSKIGYDNLLILNRDMYLEAYNVIVNNETQESSYEYNICPGTILDFDKAYDESLGADQTIVPYLENTTIQCLGDKTCIMKGGLYQFYFVPQFQVANTQITGFRFVDSLWGSVAAYGFPTSDATFKECVWDDFTSDHIIDLYYFPYGSTEDDDGNQGNRRRKLWDSEAKERFASHSYNNIVALVRHEIYHKNKNQDKTNSMNVQRRAIGFPAMTLEFVDCLFTNSLVSTSVVNNQGGSLKISKSSFENNTAMISILDVLYGGRLSMEDETSFISNTIYFVPVFIDSSSILELNTGVIGEKQINYGDMENNDCTSGIFIESDEDSYCLEGGRCYGTCCEFGDESCDSFITEKEAELMAIEEVPKPKDNTIPTMDEKEHSISFTPPTSVTAVNKNNDSDSSGNTALIVSSIVITGVVIFGLVAILIFRRQKRKQNVELGNAPNAEIA